MALNKVYWKNRQGRMLRPLFDIILEDGSLLQDCSIKTVKGFARNLRDFNNAMRFDKSIIIFRNKIKHKISTKNIYDAEVIEGVLYE